LRLAIQVRARGEHRAQLVVVALHARRRVRQRPGHDPRCTAAAQEAGASTSAYQPPPGQISITVCVGLDAEEGQRLARVPVLVARRFFSLRQSPASARRSATRTARCAGGESMSGGGSTAAASAARRPARGDRRQEGGGEGSEAHGGILGRCRRLDARPGFRPQAQRFGIGRHVHHLAGAQARLQLLPPATLEDLAVRGQQAARCASVMPRKRGNCSGNTSASATWYQAPWCISSSSLRGCGSVRKRHSLHQAQLVVVVEDARPCRVAPKFLNSRSPGKMLLRARSLIAWP
jgi:hypothetical protein